MRRSICKTGNVHKLVNDLQVSFEFVHLFIVHAILSGYLSLAKRNVNAHRALWGPHATVGRTCQMIGVINILETIIRICIIRLNIQLR